MRIDPDFSEDTVSIAIATYLAVLSFPQLRFSIEPFSWKKERFLGADARLLDHVKGIYPFYMQFKRPFAYSDTSRAKIITHRKALKPPLSTGPRTLFFELRKKQPLTLTTSTTFYLDLTGALEDISWVTLDMYALYL